MRKPDIGINESKNSLINEHVTDIEENNNAIDKGRLEKRSPRDDLSSSSSASEENVIDEVVTVTFICSRYIRIYNNSACLP